MPDDDLMEVSLATIDGGALIERFDYELRKVLENIADENTKPDAVRQVTLTLKIKPTEDRQMAGYSYQCKGKGEPIRERGGFLLLNGDTASERVAVHPQPTLQFGELKAVS